MKTRISALMDGELDAHEIASTFDALRRDPSLRADWRDFHRVGDALRSESEGSTDISARVLAALGSEPTVLVPVVTRRAAWREPALALAASLAGVAIVGWVGFGGSEERVASLAQFARPASVDRSANTADKQAAANPKPWTSGELHEYVVAHQTHASANAFAGNTRYVRTVSSVNESR